MTDPILENVKQLIGIEVDNLGFDAEVLTHLNSARSNLVLLGVDALDIYVDESTEWVDTGSTTLNALCRHYLAIKTKQLFDPSASESISNAVVDTITQLEGRIEFEVEEVEDATP